MECSLENPVELYTGVCVQEEGEDEMLMCTHELWTLIDREDRFFRNESKRLFTVNILEWEIYNVNQNTT